MSTALNSIASRAMEIDEHYANFQATKAEKTKAVENELNVQKTSPSSNENMPPARDEYVHEPPAAPIGLYRLEQDENGKPRVIFDDPEKTNDTPKPRDVQKPEDASKSRDTQKPEDASKSEETCTGNTDKVDREIEHLKEEKKRLEQQIRSASGDAEKIERLEQKLEHVEQELARKDTETYRRQHTTFSS